MAQAKSALEGVFNPDVSIRTLLDSVRANLEKNYTTVDQAETLLAKMNGEASTINQTLLDITNIMARVHNGETTKTDALDEARPLVKMIKDHCIALHLDSSLSPSDDVCETELQMLKEFITQSISLVEQHIEMLKGNEGSDGEGKAATIAEGAVTESLFTAVLNGDTVACENQLTRSESNMNSIDLMMNDAAQEGVGESIGKGISAIGNAIKTAAKKVWEFLKKVARWCIETVKKIASKVAELVKGGASKFVASVKKAASFVKSKAQAAWAALLKLVQAAKTKGGQLVAGAKEKFATCKDALSHAFESAKLARKTKKIMKISAKQMPTEVLKEVNSICDWAADMVSKGGSLDLSDLEANIGPEITAFLSQMRQVGSEFGGLAGFGNAEYDDAEESFTATDAISMAREAAKSGDLETVVESIIGMLGNNQPEDNSAPVEDEIDPATEALLLEMELLEY